MKIAIAAAFLAAAGLFSVSGSTSALANDYESYRQDPDRPNCRVVETRTTNRWGVDEIVRVRVCD
jgi:hypothetical protein